MENQDPKPARKPPPSRKGKGPTPSSWRPGVSGNPGGRPRKAFAACEAVREHVDPHEWVEAELAIARDKDKPWDVRRDSWRALIDRGFVRPPAGITAEITNTTVARDLSSVPTAELEAKLAWLDALPKAGKPGADE